MSTEDLASLGALLRRYRAAEGEEERNDALHRLLLSINCVAAGFGATG